MPQNVLYLVVLPVVHLGTLNFGYTEQILTLLPERLLATEFLPEEVDKYIQTFAVRAERYLTGGQSEGFSFEKEATKDGRIRVRVVQNVG
jgi:hypothetical protein